MLSDLLKSSGLHLFVQISVQHDVRVCITFKLYLCFVIYINPTVHSNIVSILFIDTFDLIVLFDQYCTAIK